MRMFICQPFIMADWQKWQTFLRETPLPIRRTRLRKTQKYSAKPANLPKKERKKLKYIIYILLLLLLFPLVPQRVLGFGVQCTHMSIAIFEDHVYIEKWHIFRTFEHAILAGISAIKNGRHKIFVFFAHKNACQSFLMAGFGRNGRNFWQVLFSCLPEFLPKISAHGQQCTHILWRVHNVNRFLQRNYLSLLNSFFWRNNGHQCTRVKCTRLSVATKNFILLITACRICTRLSVVLSSRLAFPKNCDSHC